MKAPAKRGLFIFPEILYQPAFEALLYFSILQFFFNKIITRDFISVKFFYRFAVLLLTISFCADLILLLCYEQL